MPKGNHEIADMQVYPVREPVSGRAYTIVRLRTKSGLTGWGESGRVSALEIEKARAAVTGKAATAYAITSSGTSLDPALNSAMLDITARACSAPMYRLLGGPTRFKARALNSLNRTTDAELAASMKAGLAAGYQAFGVPLPAPTGRNKGRL
ncbi:MAG: hypothetical protein WKF37_22105 [Bryobacteraceae bacterium]